jgi:hypothetical protein
MCCLICSKNNLTAMLQLWLPKAGSGIAASSGAATAAEIRHSRKASFNFADCLICSTHSYHIHAQISSAGPLLLLLGDWIASYCTGSSPAVTVADGANMQWHLWIKQC